MSGKEEEEFKDWTEDGDLEDDVLLEACKEAGSSACCYSLHVYN